MYKILRDAIIFGLIVIAVLLILTADTTGKAHEDFNGKPKVTVQEIILSDNTRCAVIFDEYTGGGGISCDWE